MAVKRRNPKRRKRYEALLEGYGPNGKCVVKDCKTGATVYRNAWFCGAHIPHLDPACTHSLGDSWCAYCGGSLP